MWTFKSKEAERGAPAAGSGTAAVKQAKLDAAIKEATASVAAASVDSRLPFCKDALKDGGRGTLASYFLNGYPKGEDAPPEELRQAGYEWRYDDKLGADVFYHERTGIQVWSEALDLSAPGRNSSEKRLGFHYTTSWAFSTVTNKGNEAVEIWASFKDENACFGEGVYASQWDPHEFGSIEAVLFNNYNVKSDDPEFITKRDKFWDRALYCIPILVDHEDCFDVRERVTPEMKHGIGKDRNNIPLAEGRDVLVLRITDHKDSHIHAHRDCMCPSGK